MRRDLNAVPHLDDGGHQTAVKAMGRGHQHVQDGVLERQRPGPRESVQQVEGLDALLPQLILPEMQPVEPSRRRDCRSAAPPSTFGRCINRDGERAPAKWQSRQRLGPPAALEQAGDVQTVWRRVGRLDAAGGARQLVELRRVQNNLEVDALWADTFSIQLSIQCVIRSQKRPVKRI